MQLEPGLTTEEAAAILRYAPRTLVVLRSKGGGPPYRKLAGGRVVYMPEDLRAWLDECRRTSTSDPGPTPDAPEQRIAGPTPRAARRSARNRRVRT